MSSFINREDYKAHIRNNRLDGIIELDNATLETAEKRAIKVMKSHLNARYQSNEIFEAEGEDRDEAILGYCIDIALYYLYRMANPKKVPTYRKEAYEDAMIWLDGVKSGEIIPDDLPLSLDENGNNIKAEFRYGSNPKRKNHI